MTRGLQMHFCLQAEHFVLWVCCSVTCCRQHRWVEACRVLWQIDTSAVWYVPCLWQKSITLWRTHHYVLIVPWRGGVFLFIVWLMSCVLWC